MKKKLKDLLKGLPRFSSIDENGKAAACDFVLTTNGRTAIADFSKPKGWLADAELVFKEGDLKGLSLVGFMVRETGNKLGEDFALR